MAGSRFDWQKGRGGFVSFDTLIAILPVLLLVLFAIKASVMYGSFSDGQTSAASSYGRLVSSADYLVNYGLVKKESGKYYPNWIVSVDGAEVERVGNAAGLDLHVRIEAEGSAASYGSCIYRLIAYGEEKHIAKIYFCTGGNDGNGAGG